MTWPAPTDLPRRHLDPPSAISTKRERLRRWQPRSFISTLIVTELLAALLVGTVFILVTDRQENRRQQRAEQREDERQALSVRLENLRFVREGVQTGHKNFGSIDLAGMDLSYLDLGGANLRRANLTDANLYSADLRRADLTEANFSGAGLAYARLVGANVLGADFSDRANLVGADLTDTEVHMSFISGACYDNNVTVWPEGYQPVAPSGDCDLTLVLPD